MLKQLWSGWLHIGKPLRNGNRHAITSTLFGALTLVTCVAASMTLCAASAALAGEIANESDSPAVKIEKCRRYILNHQGYAGSAVHNELRHLYGATDPTRAMEQCNIILTNEPMQDYIVSILCDWQAEKHPRRAISLLCQKAVAYPQFHAVQAACWLRTAQLYSSIGQSAYANAFYQRVIQLAQTESSLSPYKRIASAPMPAEARSAGRAASLTSASGSTPSAGSTPTAGSTPSATTATTPTSTATAMATRTPTSTSTPTTYVPSSYAQQANWAQQASIWPNQTSHANSDPWLVQNHDRIEQMRPNLLVINFANGVTAQQVSNKVSSLIENLKESSRYHGYANSSAPPFLNYHVFKFVDLSDSAEEKKGIDGNSSRYPSATGSSSHTHFSYKSLFEPQFAAYYNVPDPQSPGRPMTLGDLVNAGLVNEVWMVAYSTMHGEAFESIELKQAYDNDLRAIKGSFVQAGNGGDPEQPRIGRSLRILFINVERGPGCAMESLSHSLEHMDSGGSIPYLTPYFREYACFNLDKRYGMPFDSLYGRDGAELSYPTPSTIEFAWKGEKKSFSNYIPAGNSVHFIPNSRRDYDLDNTQPVLTTIEHYRMRDGTAGADQTTMFSPKVYDRYRQFADDCMGPWLIYWRQNMPGLNNLAKDDQGRQMKNWWPFLFY